MYYLSGLHTKITDSQYQLSFQTITREVTSFVFVIKGGGLEIVKKQSG